MITDETADFTSTLNIDCTLLLALVSDLSHGPVSAQPSFHQAISRQIECEKVDQLLPTTLWPVIADRFLVCTDHAARRMQEIVDTIGTPSEKVRTAILMGEADLNRLTTERQNLPATRSAVEEFQKLTTHTVPPQWKIPITIVQPDTDNHTTLPAVAYRVSDKLSPINRSVFLYGWSSGRTTLSSNRTVVKLIENLIRELDDDDVVGPDIWLCPTARSLLGKEKQKK